MANTLKIALEVEGAAVTLTAELVRLANHHSYSDRLNIREAGAELLERATEAAGLAAGVDMNCLEPRGVHGTAWT